MKIALAGMAHESNSFNKLTTGLESFFLIDGYDFFTRSSGSAKGIYDKLIDGGASVEPLFFARAIPSGTVRRDAYEYIKSRIIDKLRMEGPWDGVCLALHGSMAVEGCYDPEGDLLEAVRHVVGHEVPVVCALDMHATVTERMVLLSDGFSAFRTAPHVDAVETGERAAEILLHILKTGEKMVNAFVRIPMLIHGEQSETRVEPAKSLFASLFEIDKQPNVLCSSYVMGFPWADSPYGGAGALVTGPVMAKKELDELAAKMADEFWGKREEFVYGTPAMMPEDAILAAKKAAIFPLIISDTSDNPTAGASQDTTRFLQMMINAGLENAVYTCVADPGAYRACLTRNHGDVFELPMGGYYSGKVYEKFTASVELVRLAEAQGTYYAVLRAGGVIFTVSDRRCATYSPETLRALGLEPSSFNIIGIKAGYLSPEYLAIAKESIFALTEGDTALTLRNLPYVKTPRPIFPLDEM
ncbi:MAG: M81 family metallopeptidase [Defluviitaleaceae bacterium]|nr:M81 family metallopeptidase [Defluviitaleaceae bacterium]